MRRTHLLAAGAAAVAAAGLAAGALAVRAQMDGPGPRMRDAARAFLDALGPEQRKKALFPFDAEERFNWHFIPRERQGLALKEMNPDQRRAALRLLEAGLSTEGYRTANTIRELEIILHELENKSPTRDPEKYYFSIFGEPSETGRWGWRYEGHHLSLNYTLLNGKPVGTSPQFFGANPAEVRVEVPNAPPKGTRALGPEEDLARELVQSLSEEQRKVAILSPMAPPDILTSAQRKAAIQEDRGIAYASLTEDQKGLFRRLVRRYVDVQPEEIARQRVERIRASGPEAIKFAWMGGIEKGQPHYYRIQGTTFLIEYDNTQNNANHAHTVWRDFKGDFGLDLLAEHYRRHHHQPRVARGR